MEKRPLEMRHVSPDGELTLLVINDGGNYTVGFETPSPGQLYGHSHGDILAEQYGRPAEAAVAQFVDNVLDNKSLIAIAKIDRKVRDIWIVEHPIEPDPFRPENETIAFRYWGDTPPPSRTSA